MTINRNINLIKNEHGILSLDIKKSSSKSISKFYNDKPFPNYLENETLLTFLRRGKENIFIDILKKQIGYNKNILEVGCGTGQVANYLAAQSNNHVYGLDLGKNSLKLAKNFADKYQIKNIEFINGDLFDDIFQPNSFDLIYCSGVLHHTKDPKKGFEKICNLLKPGGIVVLGLYNFYGRFWTVIKTSFLKFGFMKKYAWLFDNKLREFKENREKYEAWYQDQFQHPIESLHTFDESLTWFKDNQIDFCYSLPKIPITESAEIHGDTIFKPSLNIGNPLSRVLRQILMSFQSYGKEGGLYLFIGRKNDSR